MYTDGTKIEVTANRYTLVWAKALATNKEKIKEKLAVLWASVEEVYQRGQQEISQPNFEEISSKKVANTIRKRNEALAEKEIPKEIKKT